MVRKLIDGGIRRFVVGGALFVVSCGGGTETGTTGASTGATDCTGAATGEPIKIGVVTSMSGGAAVPTPRC